MAQTGKPFPEYVNGRVAATFDSTTAIPVAEGANGRKLDKADLDGQYGPVFTPEAYGAIGDGTTDDSTALIACIAACQAADGGRIVFGPKTYRIDSQLVIPNDGETNYPRQKSMIWQGSGAYADPVGGSGPYSDIVDIGGTILDLRYTGGGSNLAKIDTRGKGILDISGITFTDGGTSSNPFIKTTNTTLHIRGNSFVGNSSKDGTDCDQDAIILGGTTTALTNAYNAAFQGYGTVIERNQFHRMRRAVLFETYANGNIVRDNNVWVSCGSNLAGGAAIEMDPTNESVFGNVISGNLIEVAHYPYAIKLEMAQGNTITGNNFYDGTATTLAYIRIDSINAKHNTIICGYGSTSYTHVSEAVTTQNLIINGNFQGLSFFPEPSTVFGKGLRTDTLNNLGAGNPEITLYDSGTYSPGIYVIHSGSPQGVVTANKGSICLVLAGGAGTTMYVKEADDLANTGWVAK